MLNEKVALVTGAGSGIGRSVALAYSREGARVAVSDIAISAGRETVAAIESAGGQAFFVETNVADASACEAMVESVVNQFGRLDIACNNAGVNRFSGPTAEYELEHWKEVIDVNLSGVFYCMRYQIAAMLTGGSGAIVNIASVLGKVGFPSVPAYVASKHGVVGLTQAAAVEYGGQGIRVNAVGPGWVLTPFTAHRTSDPEQRARLEALHPMGRLGEAEEVAELVLWLSSPKASFVTGGYYPVDGGFLAR